jgi:hypothetical protein
MFELREGHLDGFRRVAAANFEDRGLAHVRTYLGPQSAPFSDDEIRERIRASIARGAQYGLASERQIIRFVDTTYLLGENFDTDPAQSWTLEILRDGELSADERSALLLTVAEGMYRDEEAPYGS